MLKKKNCDYWEYECISLFTSESESNHLLAEMFISIMNGEIPSDSKKHPSSSKKTLLHDTVPSSWELFLPSD